MPAGHLSSTLPCAFEAIRPNNPNNPAPQVSEDFAPWEVDITTEESADLGDLKDRGMRVAIGGSCSDWNGGGCGGVAFLNVFGDPTGAP